MRLNKAWKYTGIILLFAVLGSVVSCRSSRPGDAGVLKRFYHNVTARYNSYFNAGRLFRETVDEFEHGYADSYDQLLPILKLPGESQAQNLAASMETVIAKLALLIDRHEVSRWTDDAYLMVGKANFYKRDFYNALQSLQYVYNEYDDNDIKQEALAWIGLCNMLDNRERDAETAFDIALSNIDSSATAAPFVYAAAAQFNSLRGDPGQGIPLLKQALRTAHEKKDRIRFAYITAQLHEQLGQPDSAVAYYLRVEEQKPSYEMVFNTRISIARLYSVSSGDSDGIEKELREMMEDEKNKDYIDQLYYVLGTIAEKKDDPRKAIEYYTLSAASSTINQNQKGIAYLGIAGIYFRQRDYDNARLYYDSTMTFLSPNYPAYDQVLSKSGKLQALAENTELIRREDSLQHLAGLSPVERMKIVEKAVAELIEEAEREKREARNRLAGGAVMGGNTLQNRFGNTPNTWYFYNTAALSQGYSEFLRRWGNRPNEENWRRTNKQSLAAMGTETAGDQGMMADLEASGNDPEALKRQLLSRVPLNPLQVDSSNMRIIEAYYEIASIYENDLEEPEEAIRYYQELLRRFPDNPHTAAICYSLFKLYQGKDPQLSEQFKERVLKDFPDSDYALVISNPGSVLSRREESDSRLGKFYEDTYEAFREGRYGEVIQRCQDPQVARARPGLRSMFSYLQALAVGRTDSIPLFTASLEDVYAAYPQEEPGRRAGQLLAYIGDHPAEFIGRKPVLEDGGSWLTDFEAVVRRAQAEARRAAAERAREQAEAEKASYFKKAAPGASYVVVIAVRDPQVNLTSTRFGLGQLNRRRYADKGYRHDLKTVNGELQLLSVGSFRTLPDAKQYYETLLQYRGSIVRAPADKTSVFYMTQDNFQRLTGLETEREYRYYFRVNFLSGNPAEEADVPPPGSGVPLAEEEEAAGVQAGAAGENPAEENAFGEIPATDPAVAGEAPGDPAAAEETAGIPDSGDPDSVDPAAEPGAEIPVDKPDAEIPVAEPAPSGPSEGSLSVFAPESAGSEYLLVVAVNDQEMNLNSTRLGISLFNRAYYYRLHYRHQSRIVNNETQLISVNVFKSREEAEEYYKAFMNRKEQVVKAPEDLTRVFLITTDNFELLDSWRRVTDYVRYFNTNYQLRNE